MRKFEVEGDAKSYLLAGLAVSFLPIWRSGNRGDLTFWGFILNHTIFGPPVEYVPEEDYVQELIKAGIIKDERHF